MILRKLLLLLLLLPRGLAGNHFFLLQVCTIIVDTKIHIHLESDPRLVKVTIPADGESVEETVRVLYSIMRPLSEATAEEFLQTTDLTASGLADRLQWIGYNEFRCGERTEREYWSLLKEEQEQEEEQEDGEGLQILRSGQMPYRTGHGIDKLLVMHVRYSAPAP